MSKKKREKQPISPVILLAYFHRYGWFALVALFMLITKNENTIGIGSIVYSAWTFFGYILQWRHIYCSYQNAYHMPMTPNKVRWNTVAKKDAYLIPAIFLILGILIVAVD